MDRGRKLDVSAATIVDLKAELFRKREESKQDQHKQRSNGPNAGLKLGNKIRAEAHNLGKPNPGLQLRLAKDNESRIIDDEERDAISRSRQKLEEKSRLYDKLTHESFDADEDGDTYMVDFQRKALSQLSERKSSVLTRKDEEFTAVNETTDDWVEYTDSLGRSRKCLRQDLPRMIEMDKDLQNSNPVRSEANVKDQLVPTEDAGSYQNMSYPNFAAAATDAEPRPANVQIGPVHYQGVQHNEIRSHGTGYFAFSQSESERKEQMETLNALRDQTSSQRIRSEKMKEKRKLLLSARLAKVKQRKKMQSGAVSSSDSAGDSDEDFIGPTQPVEEEIIELTPVEEKKQTDPPVPMRPWDRGKIGVLSTRIAQPFKKASQKEWVEVERDRRPNEFAPPSSYYADGLTTREQPTAKFVPPPSHYTSDSANRQQHPVKLTASMSHHDVTSTNFPLRPAKLSPPHSTYAGDTVCQDQRTTYLPPTPPFASVDSLIPSQLQAEVAYFLPAKADDPVEHMHQFFKEQADMMAQRTPSLATPSTFPPPPLPSAAFMRSVPPPTFHSLGLLPRFQLPPVEQQPPGDPSWNDSFTRDIKPKFDLSDVPLPHTTRKNQGK